MDIGIYFLFYGAYMAGVIADCITTVRALLIGFREKNQYANWLVGIFGIKRGILIACLTYAIASFGLTWPFFVWFSDIGAYAVFGIVVLFGAMALRAFLHLHMASRNHKIRKAYLAGQIYIAERP